MLLAASDFVGDFWTDDTGTVEEENQGDQVGRMVWQCDISADGLQ